MMKKCLSLLFAAFLFLSSAQAEGYDRIDIDLYRVSDTILSAMIINMQNSPDAYRGKVVRMYGELEVARNPATGIYYFTVQTADAAACCIYGLDFIWAGNHAYPEDYGQVGDALTVTGLLDTYEVAGNTYLVLKDAEVVWGF